MSVRAFHGNYEFYILQKDIPGISKGAVFYWDENDEIRGSVAEGCLKLCWTPDGNCYKGTYNNGLCGETIVFHASVRKEPEWFKLHGVKQMTIEQIEEKLGHKVQIISS